MEKIIIPKPTKEIIEEYLKKWDSTENYILQERSLNKLFLKTYPKNNDISDILIKASSLNDFYSTNIFSIFSVAKHIHKLNIDERLSKHDDTLVNDIANIEINGKNKYFYSFASKYCSHHNSRYFPIYDRYVEKILIYFRDIDNFSKFTKNDLKDYKKFKQILLNFKKYYNLDKYDFKDIDKCIWQMGKEYFPNKY